MVQFKEWRDRHSDFELVDIFANIKDAGVSVAFAGICKDAAHTLDKCWVYFEEVSTLDKALNATRSLKNTYGSAARCCLLDLTSAVTVQLMVEVRTQFAKISKIRAWIIGKQIQKAVGHNVLLSEPLQATDITIAETCPIWFRDNK